mmetsp:Transcript_14982/g.17234  ORF Transcript_14982/g.17234 Transcript_14982/m.17234 type:complete len:276 (+) Transcript_14982:99-926(+)
MQYNHIHAPYLPMKKKTNAKKRSIQFAPIEQSSHLEIPSCYEMNQIEKDCTWYSQSDLDHFKNVARFVSRVFRCCSEDRDVRRRLQKLQTCEKLRKHLDRKFMQENWMSVQLSSPSYEYNGIECLDYCPRGLEHRIRTDRQRNKRMSIHSTLMFHRESLISEGKRSGGEYQNMACKCNSWAKDVALAIGTADAIYATDCSKYPMKKYLSVSVQQPWKDTHINLKKRSAHAMVYAPVALGNRFMHGSYHESFEPPLTKRRNMSFIQNEGCIVYPEK